MSQPSSTSRALIRVVAAFPLFVIAGFCVFGFLATWELSAWTDRLPLQIGYVILGSASLFGAIVLLRGRPSPVSRLHD